MKTLDKIFKIGLLLIFSVNCFSQTLIEGLVRDANTKERLPFANVFAGSKTGTITNENGIFSLEVAENITKLTVSYVGYETQEFSIEIGKKSYLIELSKTSFPLSEIEIKAADERAYRYLFEAIKTSRKASWKPRKTKTFRRTITTRDKGHPAEFLEGFYNSEIVDGGLQNLQLKNGRVGIPLDSYVLNFDISVVLEDYQIFGDRYFYLPPSALNMKTYRQLKNEFFVRIADKLVVEKDTILEIRFEAKEPGLAFDGSAFVRQSSELIEKVKFEIESIKKIPFETVMDTENNKVEKMGAELEVGFQYKNELLEMDYLQLIMDFSIQSYGRNYELHSNSKFFFYDYDNLFELPFFSLSENYNDYEKVMAMPYNAAFWEKMPPIAETSVEKNFRKKLDEQQLFINSGSSDWYIPILKKRFLQWSDEIKLDTTLVSAIQARPGRNVDDVIYTHTGGIPNDNLFAETFIFLDYNCFEDTVIYKTEAVLDYNYTYTYKRSDLDFNYLNNFLQLTKITANDLQKELIKTNDKTCPFRDDLTKKLKFAERELKKEVAGYFVDVQMKRSEEHLEKWSIEIEKKLKEQ